MPELQYMIFTVIGLALLFDFINGFHDTANAIATSVSTRAIAPRNAILMAAVLNFLGAMYSTGVAKTIGGDIVSTWKLALPSSSSHAMVGGVIGAVLVSTGVVGLNLNGIGKIILSLILSPLIAIITGYFVMHLLYFLFGSSSPYIVNGRFKRMQIVSAAMMAFSHGSNDAQKSMGIITLALLSGGYISEFEVPTIVKLLAATAMAIGTAMGGWSIIKTIGGKIFKLEPISGFAADLNSSIVIFSATMLHLPVSTTHVVSGSIMGVGTAKRLRAVRWGVAQQMLVAWVLTIPCTALIGSLVYQIALWIF